MIELLRYQDLTKVHYYQTLLESAGIQTCVRNENLSTAQGMSIPDYYPALCIVNHQDEAAAVEIMRKDMAQAEAMADEEVICRECGEASPAVFDTCWNCTAELRAPDI